jgi:hypothetical protein
MKIINYVILCFIVLFVFLIGVSPLNVPYLYKNRFDNSTHSYGYSDSDLKNPYLSRQQLNSRIISPIININEYIEQE